jgi:SGNH hydrolase-like domain, acetyltransferase AlgX
MNNRNFFKCIILLIFVICQYLFSSPNETLNKNFNRQKSHVMVRKIATPTLANLDCAAYFSNPVLFDPQTVKPKNPPKKVGLAGCAFGGAIVTPCATLAQTPLTSDELERPMAWAALQNRLWELLKTDLFAKSSARVSGEKWSDPGVYPSYQEIVAAWLHGKGDSASLWVKIEFKPWVTFLDNTVADEDHDGFKEVYGRLDCSSIDTALIHKAFAWMRSSYCATVLTKEQVVDWANMLASYWYPKLNTDVVDMTGQDAWPTMDTEKKIKAELKGLVVAHPTIVIRGNPYGEKIYNVYVADFTETAKPAETVAPTPAAPAVTAPVTKDSSLSANFKGNAARFEQETRTFGDYPQWAKKDSAFRAKIASFVNALPKNQMGFAGKDGWLFFRKEIDYLNGGDLTIQAPDKNPLPSLKEFKAFCDGHNISLLFCVVPNKSDVYFEKLPVDAPKDPGAIVNPWPRKFLAELERAGIEVVDLLPDFLAAKAGDSTGKEALYQKHDTHWTLRGLRIAARAIADRIKTFAWYGDLAKNAVRYTLKDTVCSRLGDIVDKLPEAERTSYPADNLSAEQVYGPDAKLYKASNPDAPVMLIGDSFTGVFEIIDCKGAGVGSHIAAATGVPVDIITSWGGGPLVRDKMLRARKADLPKKRLVIYMMVARDLYNYSQLWQPLDTK